MGKLRWWRKSGVNISGAIAEDKLVPQGRLQYVQRMKLLRNESLQSGISMQMIERLCFCTKVDSRLSICTHTRLHKTPDYWVQAFASFFSPPPPVVGRPTKILKES